MKKRSPRDPARSASRQVDQGKPIAKKNRFIPRLIALVLVVGFGVGAWVQFRKSSPTGDYLPRPKGTVTFNKDIASIVFDHCAACHRPGQSAPFSLVGYPDARKHARQIAEVTARRSMPPWKPEPGYGDFADERKLSAEQIGAIQQWVAEGAIEGSAADLPPMPGWTDSWVLGTPDLVLKLPQPYLLVPEGKDVYRNFVIPIPGSEKRYVAGVEFLPDNPRVVHHAFVDIDETRESRRLAEKQNPPGFDGMELPETARVPGGQFLGWQPGKVPSRSPAGLAWVLEKNTDLVLQLHLHPSGKPETVQPSIGLYFTDQPPTTTAFRINLSNAIIDIPAGQKAYAIEDSYVLPVDVDVLRVAPHAHYLGKDLEGFATLPDGKKKGLIRIKDWDFNWQGDYRYARPIFLPKGTKLTMHFTYDNSAANVRNPNHPPQRVQYGLQTTDEMGELWFQVLPRQPGERKILAQDFLEKLTRGVVAYNEYVVRRHPDDAIAQTKLGRALVVLGRQSEGVERLRAAIRIRPDYDKPHYDLGYMFLLRNELPEARTEFETVLRLNPDDYQAHGSLGSVYLRQRDLDQAEYHFASALRLNPDDAIARRNLELVRRAKALRN